MSFNIVFVLYPGFEELDFAGPYEVFGAAGKSVAKEWQLFTVGGEEIVQGSHGLKVKVDCLFEEAPEAHLLVVPGGRTRRALEDARTLNYVTSAGRAASWVTSVCTGSILLRAAGLLEGRRATTYWGAIDYFRNLGGVEVVDDARWVEDGNVVTAAGVSAGIDMALYMVGRLVSPKAAREVQRYIEYSPDPPYQDLETG